MVKKQKKNSRERHASKRFNIEQTREYLKYLYYLGIYLFNPKMPNFSHINTSAALFIP
jgi:hypothetical protein